LGQSRTVADLAYAGVIESVCGTGSSKVIRAAGLRDELSFAWFRP
jgi:hypothetical protein